MGRINEEGYLESTVPVIFGNSGGSIIVYRRECQCYHLVGVVESIPGIYLGNDLVIPAPHFTLAIPMPDVARLLFKNHLLKSLPEGVALEEDAPAKDR